MNEVESFHRKPEKRVLSDIKKKEIFKEKLSIALRVGERSIKINKCVFSVCLCVYARACACTYTCVCKCVYIIYTYIYIGFGNMEVIGVLSKVILLEWWR